MLEIGDLQTPKVTHMFKIAWTLCQKQMIFKHTLELFGSQPNIGYQETFWVKDN